MSSCSTLVGVHLPYTLSIAFETTVFSLIPKENTTVSIASVLKWHGAPDHTIKMQVIGLLMFPSFV
jgi:hypothetical protein